MSSTTVTGAVRRALGGTEHSASALIIQAPAAGGTLHVATLELGERIVVVSVLERTGARMPAQTLDVALTGDWERTVTEWIKHQVDGHTNSPMGGASESLRATAPRAAAVPQSTIRPPLFSHAPPPLFPAVGDRDRDPVIPGPLGTPSRGGDDGMLVGPNHPLMQGPHRMPHARFDPVAPFGPYGPGGGSASGDPDFDEMLPPQPYSHMFI